jgi:hypothetical protein
MGNQLKGDQQMTVRASTWIGRLNLAALLAALVMLSLAPFGQALSGDRPAPLPQPTEAQLGAPTYPGATYDGQMSAGLSQGETYYWVFSTSDPAPKVAAFYKQKTGLVPMEIEGNYQFAIKKGDNPYFPDQGITVEPNKIFAGGQKTAITFIKKK